MNVLTEIYQNDLTHTLLTYDLSIYGNLVLHLLNDLPIDSYLGKYVVQCFGPYSAKQYLERNLFEKMRDRRNIVSHVLSPSVVLMEYKIAYKETLVQIRVHYQLVSNSLKDKCYFLHDALSVSRKKVYLRKVDDILDFSPNPLGKICTLGLYYYLSRIPDENHNLYETLQYLFSKTTSKITI